MFWDRHGAILYGPVSAGPIRNTPIDGSGLVSSGGGLPCGWHVAFTFACVHPLSRGRAGLSCHMLYASGFFVRGSSGDGLVCCECGGFEVVAARFCRLPNEEF